MDQRVLRGERVLFAARVTVVCVAENGRPARIPADVAARVQGADLAPK